MRSPAYAAAGLLFGLLALTACSGNDAPAQGEAPPPPAVTVSTPLVQEVTDWDDHIGRFEAVEHVEIRPRVTGYLVEVGFEDGAMVEAGELLFRIDPRPFEAALSAARSRLSGAETRRQNAATELERARGLREIDAVSQEEFDALNAALMTAQSEVEAARAAVESAELDVGFTRITAPIAGRASYRRIDVGNVVRADETLMTTLVSVDPIHFTFETSEALYLQYQRENRGGLSGSPVRIRLQGETGHDWTGRLDFMDNTLDSGSGTIRGRALVENPAGFLTPGMFGHLQLQAGAPYEGLLLPDTAISTRGAQRIVFVVDEAGMVSSRAIEMGPLFAGLRVIREGISAEDRVVINGIQRAVPGSRVTTEAGSIETAPEAE